MPEEQLLYQDDHCVIFSDKKPSAHAHLQCVPKRHIKDCEQLRPTDHDIQLLKHMYEVGERFLKTNFPSPQG